MKRYIYAALFLIIPSSLVIWWWFGTCKVYDYYQVANDSESAYASIYNPREDADIVEPEYGNGGYYSYSVQDYDFITSNHEVVKGKFNSDEYFDEGDIVPVYYSPSNPKIHFINQEKPTYWRLIKRYSFEILVLLGVFIWSLKWVRMILKSDNF